MIYEETYQALLRTVSSTEFDVCLYSLSKLDWNGYVRATTKEIAKQVGSTNKYIKQVIRKLSSQKGRYIFVPEEGREGLLYRFNLGKTALQFSNTTDRYCKKYKFFYTDEFRALPINAKRVLLMGAFRMSVLKNEEVAVHVDEMIPSTHNDNNIPLTKKRLVEAICAINMSSLRGTVEVGLATNLYTEREEVVFSFTKGTLQQYKENYTERTLLRRKLIEAGYHKLLPEETCIEIERVGKYLYSELMRKEKELVEKNGTIVGIRDELLTLARFIYDAAVQKLGQALVAKGEELVNPKQVSAYFSTIVHHIVTEEMSKYAHQVNSMQALMDMVHTFAVDTGKKAYQNAQEVGKSADSIYEKKAFYNRLFGILKDWCAGWIIARLKQVSTDVETLSKSREASASVVEKRGWRSKEDILRHMEEIKETAYEQFNSVKEQLKTVRHQVLPWKEHIRFLEDIKGAIEGFFAVNKRSVEKNAQAITW